jgi:hypothetical protein
MTAQQKHGVRRNEVTTRAPLVQRAEGPFSQ